jgi:hypothetical protein
MGGIVKHIAIPLVFFIAVSAAASAKAPERLNRGDRPFIDTERIDLKLLREQLNLSLGDAVRDLGIELPFDERIARAADFMVRHPELADSTDEDGYLIPFDRRQVEKEGFPCGFIMKSTVSSKTTCGSVRNFDDSDTYGVVASRYVDQMMESNADIIRRSDFKAYGVGVMLTEEYPRMIDGRVLTDEPKDEWIHVLFFIVMGRD